MTRSRCLLLLPCLALAACAPETCTDIECVMAHFSVSLDGERLPLRALPASQVPAPRMMMSSDGDFDLLITPLSAPNWGDPVEMIEAGLTAAVGAGGPDAAITPQITNQPAPIMLSTPSASAPLDVDFVDPNGEVVAFCFAPASKGRPYAHCVYCTPAVRDGKVAARARLSTGIDALVVSPINFDLQTNRACKNPLNERGQPENPVPGCPLGQIRCGNGCIPDSTVCCGALLGDTTSYCTNASGGACSVTSCDGQQNCCNVEGTIGSNDCPANQHHCGLGCRPLDDPCCPFGSTDPGCNGHLVAGAPVAVGVVAPHAGAGGGGGGGGGGDGCDFSGTWSGPFNYTYHDGPGGTSGQGSLTLTVVMENIVSFQGMQTLRITRAQISDPAFGATQPVTPTPNASVALLPTAGPALAGHGVAVFLQNTGHVATANEAGALLVSSDCRTLQNSAIPAIVNDTWTAGPGGVTDSNTAGSGPGGHAYNAVDFTSWKLVHQ